MEKNHHEINSTAITEPKANFTASYYPLDSITSATVPQLDAAPIVVIGPPPDIIGVPLNSPAVEEEEEVPPVELLCGLWSWRPAFLQRCRDIRVFLACMVMISCIQSSLSLGYISSQITTLEKRFSLGSSTIGMVTAFFEVGYVGAVVVVSYFGSRGRIPVWIAGGVVVMGVGAFLISLPHFLAEPYSMQHKGNIKKDLCHLPVNISTTIGATNPFRTKTAVDAQCKDKSAQGNYWFVVFCFVCGQILIGSGSSPILTLAPTFIDDHVPAEKAPAMIAALYAGAALGPLFGHILGALMLQLYVDFYSVDAKTLKTRPGDPTWIGAWWMGFMLLGMASLCGSFFMFLFPRRLKKEPTVDSIKSREAEKEGLVTDTKVLPLLSTDHVPTTGSVEQGATAVPVLCEHMRNGEVPLPPALHTEQRTRSSIVRNRSLSSQRPALDAYGRDWKAMPRSIVQLIRNPIYVIACVAICFEMFLVTGFASFLPKYLETEFHITNQTASLLAGVCVVPAGSLGILSGGLILNRFKLSRKNAVRFVLCVNVVIALGLGSGFFLGCSNPQIAGVTTPYTNETELNTRNLSTPCNSDCLCDKNYWNPVCDEAKGLTYFSPCYAGCTMEKKNSKGQEEEYTNCGCTGDGSIGGSVKGRRCSLSCYSLIPFMIFLTLALYLVGTTQNPLLMVIMRSVGHHERAFALGFQFVILRLLAYVPSPIVYGKVIDKACMRWKFSCGTTGDCVVTDLTRLRLNLTGLATSCKLLAFVFYVVLFFHLPSTQDPDDDKDGQPNQVHDCQSSSLTSEGVALPCPLCRNANQELEEKEAMV